MVLVLIIILSIIFWFYKTNVKKRLRNSFTQKTLNRNTPNYIRKHWREKRIDAEHCDVMNENTTFDFASRRRQSYEKVISRKQCFSLRQCYSVNCD